MNCDWPAGVVLVIVVVRVTAVFVPVGAVVTATCTGRYWSSLFPPRLMTDTSSERGVRLPLTPFTTHAAWSTGSLDHTMRWRPATAEDTADARARMSRLWPCSWRRMALVSEPRASWREVPPVALSVRPSYWSWRRNGSTVSAVTVCPPAWTGPVASRSWRRPATSMEITPSTGWPVSVVHMVAANGAV